MALLRLARWLLDPGSRLSQRVAHASVWRLALRVTERLLGTARTIILARFLAPEDFGVMGVALFIVGLAENLTVTGFKAALVQRKGDIKAYLDTAWTVEVLRGLATAAVLVATAPLLARFFGAPDSGLIVQVIALSVFLGGLNNIAIVHFHKGLEFQKRFLFQLARILPEAGIGIGLAVTLQSVWALAYGVVIGSLAQLVASYMLHPYRPRLRLDRARARELYRFGVWVYLGDLLQSARRADAAVIARLLGPVALATYELGRGFTERFTREIRNVLSQVAFPVYAQVQDDLPRLRKGYFITIEVIAAVTFPLATLVFLLSEPLTRVVLGEKWLAVAPLLGPLAAAGAIRSVTSVGGELFKGIGRPALSFTGNLARTLANLALFFPLIKLFGLPGAGLAVLIAALAILPGFLWYSRRVVQASPRQLALTLLPAVALSAVVAATVTLSRAMLRDMELGQLILTATLVGISYLAACVVLWQLFRSGPLQALLRVRPRL